MLHSCNTIVLTLGSIVFAATLLANDDTKSGHATPEEAFDAYQQGFKKGDAARVSRSITNRRREAILLREWTREGELRFPGPHIKPIVSKYVDEERRQELTRQELPLKQHELSSVLARSIEDQELAFFDLIENLDEKSRELNTVGKLSDFKVDGERASAVLEEKDYRPLVVHFVKAEHGWLVDRFATQDDAKDPEQLKNSAPPSKPWKDAEPPRYDTPEEVADALYDAVMENDPEKVWHCVTEETRPRIIQSSLGIMMAAHNEAAGPLTWYVDSERYLGLVMRPRGPTAKESQDALLQSVREPKVLFSASIKQMCEFLHSVPKEQRKHPELRDLKIKGDEARGAAKVVFPVFKQGATPAPGPPRAFKRGLDPDAPRNAGGAPSEFRDVDMPLTFKKTGHGWRMHLPPPPSDGRKESDDDPSEKAGAPPDDPEAIKAIEKAGGEVLINKALPGQPVLEVKLQGRRFTDSDIANVAGFSRLESLWLGSSQVGDEGLVHLKNLRELRSLSLVLTKVKGDGLAHLKGLHKLENLDLHGCPLQNDALKHVGELKGLQSLNLNSTKVTDGAMKHLQGAKNLVGLYLYGTKVTDEGLAHLQDLAELQTLVVSETGVTNEGLKPLQGLKKLLHVSALETRVTDKGVADLKAALPEVTVVYKLED